MIDGGEMRLIDVDDDQVRLFSGLDGADVIGQAQRCGPAHGGHAHHRGRVHDRGIEPLHLVQLGQGIHLPPQVQVVVAGAPVGADADGDAGLEEIGNRRHARPQFHVAFRAMGDGCPAGRDLFDVTRIHPDGMDQ